MIQKLNDMEQEHERIQFEFLPLTLSIETRGGISTPIMQRGTPLPTTRSQTFSTASDNQESVEINVFLGERPLASKNLLMGSCTLKGIPPAPKAKPQIAVTFEVDKYCDITVKAVELKSGSEIKTKMVKEQLTLSKKTINKMLRDAEANEIEDKARSLMKTADLRIRDDQERNLVTETTRRIESLIGEVGIALTEGTEYTIALKTEKLEKLLNEPTLDFGYGDIFGSFFAPRTTQKQPEPQRKTTESTIRRPERTTPLPETSPPTTTFIQSFLEGIDPELEAKRMGAWEALNSNRPEGLVQATHSMREVLRQLMDTLSPVEKVQNAPWYEEPKDEAKVTRNMRIRYAIAGDSMDVSESTLDLIKGYSAATNSVYSKLSAQSHSDKKPTVTATRMYLVACETVIGLIATAKL